MLSCPEERSVCSACPVYLGCPERLSRGEPRSARLPQIPFSLFHFRSVLTPLDATLLQVLILKDFKSFGINTYRKPMGGCMGAPPKLSVTSSQSDFAGTGYWLGVLFARGRGMRSGDDQNDCSKNHDGGYDRAQRDGFVRQEPAKNQR